MSTKSLVPVSAADEPAVPAGAQSRPPAAEIAAWILMAALLLFVLLNHLVGGAITALALYVILEGVSERISRRLARGAVRPVTVVVVTLATAALVVGVIALLVTMLRHGASNIPDMMNQMADILASVRLWLGGLGHEFIPEFMTDAEDLKGSVAEWLKTHAQNLRAGGLYIGVGLIHIIMGGLLAIMIFFRHVTRHDHSRDSRPLAHHLLEKVDRFADAFARVASAQIKISAVNTSLTAVYLLVGLPLFGIRVPFATTLVVVTFVCGLIPVVGNLISNTVITILSMGVSIGTAVASLLFLILIHKLEYLINSKIVGGETDSQAWEILMAIILGEAAFGIGGVIMGPIIYAFVKRELRERSLV